MIEEESPESPEKPLVAFFDSETSGLKPYIHEMLEVAVVQTDLSLNEVARVAVKIRPTRIETAEAQALEINGYTPDGWKDAVGLDEALALIMPYIRGAVIWGGHNVAFDINFLVAACKTRGISVPFPGVEGNPHIPFVVAPGAVIDTMRMARAAGLPKKSLGAVCEHFGIAQHVQHRALADTLTAIEIAQKFRHRRMVVEEWPGAICLEILEEIEHDYSISTLTVDDVVAAPKRDALVRQYAWTIAVASLLKRKGLTPKPFSQINKAIIDRWGSKAIRRSPASPQAETAALVYIKSRAWRLLRDIEDGDIESIAAVLM